jgi:large subunit ribosomal protein L19
MELLEKISQEQAKAELPDLRVGDTVRVHTLIREGAKERIQIFTGTVIAHQGGGVQESITVRRVQFGIGAERVFPVHSPRVAKIEIQSRGDVRRAKLYYLRDRVGKAARVKEQLRRK